MAELENKIPVTIKLRKPIFDQNEKKIEEIVIDREPTAGDFADFEFNNQTTDGFIRALSRIVGIPAPLLRKLGMADTLTIVAELRNFL